MISQADELPDTATDDLVGKEWMGAKGELEYSGYGSPFAKELLSNLHE